jgi:hypothetical protein
MDKHRTQLDTTNLMHESIVANTCNAAITALAGSILAVFGNNLEQAVIDAVRKLRVPLRLLEKILLVQMPHHQGSRDVLNFNISYLCKRKPWTRLTGP